MVNVTPVAKLYFNSDTAQAYVRDTTVWPVITTGSGNVPLNELLNIKGLGSLTNPSGGFVFNVSNPSVPLIDIADGDVQSANYNLPTSSGSIVVGQYTLAYTASGSYSSTGNAIEGGGSGYIELDDDNTSAMLLQAGDSVVISGDTNPSLNGTWTVVSTSYTTGGTFSRLYVSQNGSPIGGGAADGNVAYSITRTYATNEVVAYSGCTKVTPALNWTASPYSGEFGTALAADGTEYGTSSVANQEVTVYYPQGLSPAPDTNPVTGTSVTISPLASGTYTIELNADVTFTQADGLNIVYSLAGIRVNGKAVNTFERTVYWREGLCSIKSCIDEVYTQHNNLLKQGKPSPYTALVADLALAINRYDIAVTCGNADDVNACYQDILGVLELMKCTCACNCDGANGPQWITNSTQDGGSAITVLQDEIDDLTAALATTNTNLATLQTQVNDIQTVVDATPLVYVAHLSQGTGGSSVSVDYVMANTLSFSPSFTYISAGQVRISGTAGQLPQVYTEVTFQETICSNSPQKVVVEVETSNNSFVLYGTNSSGAYSNGNINGILKIVVYPS